MPTTFKKISTTHGASHQRYIILNKASSEFLDAFNDVEDAAVKAKRYLETGLDIQIFDNLKKRVIYFEVDKYGRIFLF